MVLRWGRWQRCHSDNNDDNDGDGDDQDLIVLSFGVDGGEVFIGDYGDNDGGQNQSQDLFVASRWSFASMTVEMMMMFKKIKDKAKL